MEKSIKSSSKSILKENTRNFNACEREVPFRKRGDESELKIYSYNGHIVAHRLAGVKAQ